MSKKFSFINSLKYIVIILFLIFSVASVFLFREVKINYNISDYLDDSTDTKISLGIMEEEFGLISNIQVMIDDISVDEAEKVKEKLKSVENVTFVNFSVTNESYYKDGSALFVILVDGNEYSGSAKGALADITEMMDNEYGDRVNYGGAVMEKKLLREAIIGEIFLILGISIALVAILMLITAGSWIEPLVLLAASGIAVLLNMGTNAFYGEISYITNAIAAILQLALSIDYSIILLHSYRSVKASGEECDNEHAMLRAITKVVSPVSASALTTIAGLLALLFMSFTIGRDIGMVLIKSIVISAITSLTLLPAFLLIFDKLMQKTEKKALVIKGKKISEFAIKGGKFIVPVALVLIVVCCILNLNSSYNFVDSCNSNEKISDKFGDSGTLVVLYENADDAKEKEETLIRLLEAYRTEDDKSVLKNHVAYSNTIGQIFNVEKASNDLGIDKKDAELLFTLYEFTRDESAVKMTTREFAEFATKLITSDPDAQGFVSEETANALDLLLTLDEIFSKEYSSREFYNEITKLEMMQGKDMSQFAINQMYGLYFYDNAETKYIDFKEMLQFIIDSDMLDSSVMGMSDQPSLSENLTRLLNAIDDFVDFYPTRQMSLSEFQTFFDYVGNKNGFTINKTTLAYIWAVELKLNPTRDTIGYLEFMKALLACADKYSGLISIDIPTEFVNIVNNYESLYKNVNMRYTYDQFIPALVKVIETINGIEYELNTPSSAIQQLYIMYFYENNMLKTGKISAREFIEYIMDTAKTNATVASQLPDGVIPMLGDVLALDDFLDDTNNYDYPGMTARIIDFANSITSMEVSVSLSEAAMMGLYVKYATANNLVAIGKISATDLLAFVLDASENNELLSSRITEEMKETIRESQENMLIASGLLLSDNYSRILLTIDLPAESKESSAFVEYLSSSVKDIFGNRTYVAGEMATTNDLIKAFDDDNRFISIFTVVSIFLIVMVVFKSLSLPVILVAIIQGAVWIAMSMSFGGNSMFFMSYIMSMCILMGATIDYGILLSTSYVRARETLDKREAIVEALNTALPTVFTSGIILMVCGLVVGLVATQTSISSVGFLLCRGTLVSTIMIVFVLPAILYILDKLVVKLTITKSLGEILKIKGKK